jgi:MFS family permease
MTAPDDHLIVTRVLLGLFESGFLPAASYICFTWYCRYEVQTRLGTLLRFDSRDCGTSKEEEVSRTNDTQKRDHQLTHSISTALFFSTASLALAFSGLLAAAIVNMDGIAGLAGWRWIFILEGILTVVVGASLYWILPDSPQTASWLEPWERQYLVDRLAQDSGTGVRVQTAEKFQWRYITAALSDWKIYLGVVIYWAGAIPSYGFTYSAPTIIHNLGYTSIQAQLLTVPVYVAGTISTLFFSWLSDRHQTRWPYILIPLAIVTCAFIALLAIPHPKYPGLTYGVLFAIPAGVNPPIIGIISWVGNNLSPTWKRSVGMVSFRCILNVLISEY